MVDSRPSSLAEFVNRKVHLTLSDGSTKEGWVYTVDPVTKTFVMLETSGAGKQTHSSSLSFVMGHAVQCARATTKAGELCPDFDRILKTGTTSSYSDEQLRLRKSELKVWLERNRLPVTEKEGEVLCVLDVLRVEPPYEMDCCRCSNEIILDRIQRLIRNMPRNATKSETTSGTAECVPWSEGAKR